MKQALYAHMNNKRKMKKKKESVPVWNLITCGSMMVGNMS
jgi:hypothetical protein